MKARNVIAAVAMAASVIATGTVTASASPAASPYQKCLNAADAANWAGHLASLERARDARLAVRATQASDSRLASEATAGAAGLGPLITDIRHRVALAGEYLDNGQYGKCLHLLRAWA